MMKSVTISVKIPIMASGMSEKENQRLRQITGRDTRIIRAALGVIQQHERELLRGRNRIDMGALQRLTLTATRKSSRTRERTEVPHDFKRRFPRAPTTELQECLRTAAAMYESYLALRRKKGWNAGRPGQHRQIPRWICMPYRARLQRDRNGWYIDLRDSMDTAHKQRVHNRLRVPLCVVRFHREQLQRGSIQAVQIFRDRNRKWWATIAVRLTPSESQRTEHSPPAVLGIDLGIRKAACATLITEQGVSVTRYFYQREKAELIEKYDRRVASLQHEMMTRRDHGLSYDRVAEKLRKIRKKRANIAKEYDLVLVKQLREFILELSERYDLHVAIGRLSGIRNGARKGNWRGKKFRGMIHRWAFARVTERLRHQLSQRGWKVSGRESRFRVIPENWTSIMCWRCGRKGTRPRQALFMCRTCGLKTNADRNGSINIARRLITLTSSLREVRGLARWGTKPKRAKARGPSGRGKSLPPHNHGASRGRGSAVAVTVQTTLHEFDNPAVVRDAEDPTVTGNDAPGVAQGEGGRVIHSGDEAPANTGPVPVGGDTCRGRAERIDHVQTSSPHMFEQD